MDVSMYCDYFNFTHTPFTEDSYFNNIRLSAAKDFLLHKLSHGGIAVLSGDKGVGKTWLAHEVAQQSQCKVLVLSAASVISSENEGLGQLLACYFHLEKWRKLSSSALPMRVVEAFEHHDNSREPWLIVVDNAENLTKECYDFLKTFKGYPHSRLVSFLLVEQGEVSANNSKHRQIALPPHVYYHLTPLSVVETCEYLSQRLEAVNGDRGLFDPVVSKLLHKASKGRFQVINALASDALSCAYAEQTPSVTYKQMKVCIEACGLSSAKKACLALVIASYMLLGGVLGWFYFSYTKPYLPVPMTFSEKLHEIPAAAKTLRDVGSNERSGMRQLFQVWGYDVPLNDAFCDQAPRAQLSCKKGEATFDSLLKEGIPWMSPILVDDQKIYVTVVKVTNDTMDILIKGETWEVQRSWFNEVWNGGYVQFLPQAPSGKNVINKSSPKADTAWIDMMLSKILNLPYSKTGLWDKELIEKVKSFQQRENLVVDGLVGKGTLIQIAKRNGNMPVLLTQEDL